MASSTDSAAYGYTSLLQHINAKLQTAGLTDWEFALQTLYNGASGIAASASGHVWVKTNHAGDTIKWSVGSTVDPRWFGVHQDTTTTALTAAGWQDISDWSSVLAFIGQSLEPVTRDRPRKTYRVRQHVARDAHSYARHYGGVRGRVLQLKVSGAPRLEDDSTYHRLRRFVDALYDAMTGLRFLYVPDLSLLSWNTYDPDLGTDDDRFGQEDLQIDLRRTNLDWDDGEEFEGWFKEWSKDLVCKERVA